MRRSFPADRSSNFHCIISLPASNKLEQCPDFKREMSDDGRVDNDYERTVRALVGSEQILSLRCDFPPIRSDVGREKASCSKRRGAATRGRQIEGAKGRDG